MEALPGARIFTENPAGVNGTPSGALSEAVRRQRENSLRGVRQWLLC